MAAFLLAWLASSLAGLALALPQAAWLVPRLREPADGASLGKPAYASLPTPRRLAVLAAVVVAAQAATAAQPAAARGLWLVAGSSVLVLVWVDALTTWLPAPLAWSCLAQMGVAGALGAFWAPSPGTFLAHVALGGAAAWGLWWLLWRITRGGLGYGDVRLAPLIGALAGSLGLTGWLAAWLAGSLVGLVWGLVVRRRAPAPGTRAGFAYGPGLWSGPYLALAWLALV